MVIGGVESWIGAQLGVYLLAIVRFNYLLTYASNVRKHSTSLSPFPSSQIIFGPDLPGCYLDMNYCLPKSLIVCVLDHVYMWLYQVDNTELDGSSVPLSL
jgi:hypothetical protein